MVFTGILRSKTYTTTHMKDQVKFGKKLNLMKRTVTSLTNERLMALNGGNSDCPNTTNGCVTGLGMCLCGATIACQVKN
jgi:hypothetical protein